MHLINRFPSQEVVKELPSNAMTASWWIAHMRQPND